MRQLKRLSVAQIRNIGPGKHADGGGLWYHKRPDGGSQWFLRITVHGKRREMGLGSGLDVSLKEARERAKEYRESTRSGVDPIEARQRLRRDAAKPNNIL